MEIHFDRRHILAFLGSGLFLSQDVAAAPASRVFSATVTRRLPESPVVGRFAFGLEGPVGIDPAPDWFETALTDVLGDDWVPSRRYCRVRELQHACRLATFAAQYLSPKVLRGIGMTEEAVACETAPDLEAAGQAASLAQHLIGRKWRYHREKPRADHMAYGVVAHSAVAAWRASRACGDPGDQPAGELSDGDCCDIPYSVGMALTNILEEGDADEDTRRWVWRTAVTMIEYALAD